MAVLILKQAAARCQVFQSWIDVQAKVINDQRLQAIEQQRRAPLQLVAGDDRE